MKILLIILLTTQLLIGCSEENKSHGNIAIKSYANHHADDHHDHDKLTEDEHGDDHKAGHHDEETGVVKLSPQQLRTADIKVTPVTLHEVAIMLRAPGEVKLNAYRTVKITSRIAAQVVARHARLGDNIEKGQPLLTLSSVEMANAQGELLITAREWQRVKKLGRKVVSERRYTQVQVNWEKANVQAKAFGMTNKQIADLLNKNTLRADGTFRILAPQAGRLLHDAFIVGEWIEPGRELMVISDESVMWVEARVTANEAGQIHVGNAAQIQFFKQELPAKVSQIHHALDEKTRTLAVRLEVANPEDRLHPGMFVTARIQSSNQTRALVVPEAAVLRSPDGDWQVLVEQHEPGEFKAVEVGLERVIDGQAIITGIQPGMRIVTQGAFFVRSELAKSGFEVHAH